MKLLLWPSKLVDDGENKQKLDEKIFFAYEVMMMRNEDLIITFEWNLINA